MARIAVVEDEPGLLQFCTRLLSERGHTPIPAKDGQDALDLFAEAASRGETPCDLVISDLQMPRMDGIALCRALRERYDRAQLPIVLVSVLDAEDDILRAFEAGANDYITKPYRTGVLLAKVALLLRERELLARHEPLFAPRPRQPDVHEAKTPVVGPTSGDERSWADSSLAAAPPVPPFTFDRYDVDAVIGKGGMSVVYRARDRESGATVALKLLSPHVAQDRHGLARFLREVAVLRRIETPHVVRALDSGLDRGLYFLTMDLVEGESAKALIAASGAFQPRRAAAIGRDVALALGALASEGLVHRDVKPSNFIVRTDGRAVLVDFGLARKQLAQDLTETGEAVGTPHYLAPEVVQGEAATPASDLYALGASLFEMLAGKKPYTGRTCFEVFHRAIAGPPADLAAERPDLPPALVEVVGRLLERDPRKRLTPAETVADALELFAR